MFNILKNKKITQLLAPISGQIIPIEEIPDEAFAQKIVGDGIGIDPISEFVLAPCDGHIGKIFRSNHGFSLISKTGLEIFVHYGVDTVKFEGKGFKRIAVEGAEVKAGDKILKADLDFLKKNAKSVITLVIISNMDELRTFRVSEARDVVAGETVIIEAAVK